MIYGVVAKVPAQPQPATLWLMKPTILKTRIFPQP
jgi:hypothetical protein